MIFFFHFVESGRNGYPGQKGQRGDVGEAGPNVRDEYFLFHSTYYLYLSNRFMVVDDLVHIPDHRVIQYVLIA